MEQEFIIAGMRLRIVNAERLFDSPECHLARAFAPFAAKPEPETVPSMRVLPDIEATEDCIKGVSFQELDRFPFEDAEADCLFARSGQGHLLRMDLRGGGRPIRFYKAFDSVDVYTDLPAEKRAVNEIMLRYGLWFMFGIAISREAIAIHSSTIEYGGKAVLFLGESGTGKSTHTRLWREHISGARLLNDDSPIIRMYNGVPTVFGSAWSGKTPCYRNIARPIAGIVRLTQAPQNRIERLSTLRAIGALLPSCPPPFAFDAELQDRICLTLSCILEQVPVYHLACLPDRAAAELSFQTIFPA